MPLTFRFEKVISRIFGTIYRPVALVEFQSQRSKEWLKVKMVVDSGADYTLLPDTLMKNLEIDPKRDCKPFETHGVGGAADIYLCKKT